jgi:septin family protein
MHDLKDVTNNVHYENFRYRNLAPVSGDGVKVRTGSSSSNTSSKLVNKLINYLLF